jgi:hypothetical protein
MKKSLFGLFVLALVTMSMAGAWTAPTAFPIMVSSADTVKRDSITGIDSIIIVSKKTIDPTATYALETMDSVASGDSVYVWVTMYDSKGTQITAVSADTIRQTITTRISDLPINKTVWGSTFTLKLRGAVAVFKKLFKTHNIIRIAPVQPNQVQFMRPY